MREEVLVVVHRAGLEFLVLRRAPAKGGYWMPPAGRVEDAESPAAAAERELAEETGLRASVVPVGIDASYETPDGPVRVHAFAAEAPASWEPTLNDEHVAYRWCAAADADRTIAYPAPRAAVRAVARALGKVA